MELTRSAEDDLEAIHAYLSEHCSTDAADALLDATLEKIETLERFSDRGNIPKELDALGIREFRQTLRQPYRRIYRVIYSRVFIMVIADGRRDMQGLLERRLLSR